jgi:hypothetical protein
MKLLLSILLILSALSVHAQVPTNKYLDWIFRADDAAHYQGVLVKTYAPVTPGPVFYVGHEGEHRFVYDYNHMLTAVWYKGQSGYHIVRPMILDSVDRLFIKLFPGQYFNSHVSTADFPKKGVLDVFSGYKTKTK